MVFRSPDERFTNQEGQLRYYKATNTLLISLEKDERDECIGIKDPILILDGDVYVEVSMAVLFEWLTKNIGVFQLEVK